MNKLWVPILLLFIGGLALSCTDSGTGIEETDTEEQDTTQTDTSDSTSPDSSDEFSINLKVRAWHVYLYNQPINLTRYSDSWDSITELKFVALPDGQPFTVQDGQKSKEFVYGDPYEYKNGGIFVPWQDSVPPVVARFPSTRYSEIGLDTVNGPLYNNRNKGINPQIQITTVKKAGFEVKLRHADGPEDFNLIQRMEMRIGGQWKDMSAGDLFLGKYKKSYTAFFEELPLEEYVTIRAFNGNGYEYTQTWYISIAPYVNITYDEVPKEIEGSGRLGRMRNEIILDLREYKKDLISNRSQRYFRLPDIGDTLKYTFLFHPVEYTYPDTFRYNLTPISISTSPDTIISYERYRYYSDEFPWPNKLENPRVDTTKMRIKNKRINTLEFYPTIKNTADGVYTHYNHKLPDPYTVVIHNANTVFDDPPYDDTRITFKRGVGIVKIEREVQPYKPKYHTILYKEGYGYLIDR